MSALHRIIVAALLLLCATVRDSSAQNPFIAVYFDSDLEQYAEVCQGIGVIDTLWVAAINFNAHLVGVEFRIDYPPEITWITDINIQPVTIGGTGIGFSMGWNIPQNGFDPLVVCNPIIIWNCGRCLDDQIVVQPHPATGFLGAVRFPDFTPIGGVGLSALVCPVFPVEETTWGRVKEIYSE